MDYSGPNDQSQKSRACHFEHFNKKYSSTPYENVYFRNRLYIATEQNLVTPLASSDVNLSWVRGLARSRTAVFCMSNNDTVCNSMCYGVAHLPQSVLRQTKMRQIN